MSRLGSQFPVTAGVEAAGIVEKLGAKVDGVAIGERVAFANIGCGELNRCRGACHTRFFVCLLFFWHGIAPSESFSTKAWGWHGL